MGPIAIHHHYGAGTGREREGGLAFTAPLDPSFLFSSPASFIILPLWRFAFRRPLHSSAFLSSSSAEGGKWRAVWRGGRFKAEGPLPAGGGRPFFISFSQTRNCGGGGGLYRSEGLRAPSPCVQMASGREGGRKGGNESPELFRLQCGGKGDSPTVRCLEEGEESLAISFVRSVSFRGNDSRLRCSFPLENGAEFDKLLQKNINTA